MNDSNANAPEADALSLNAEEATAIQRLGGFQVGQVVAGRYEVQRLLGRGGMGAVYAVTDAEFDGDTVALKTVLPELDRHGDTLRRFRREVKIARKVTHPSACRIYDVGYHAPEGGGEDAADVVFVTMELLDGDTLSAYVKERGPLSTDEALPLARDVAEGLGAIHEAGIVHRDLKGGNIMIVCGADAPRAVVTDFGLACLSKAEAGSGQSITTEGDFIGSPMYMAPEQLKGDRATSATDVYAFGVLLYEMLTGRYPHEGDTLLAVAVKRLQDDPTPPSAFTPDIEPIWEQVLLTCLAREPANRYPTAADAVAALESGTVPSSPPLGQAQPPGGAARKHRRDLLVALVLVLAGLGLWMLSDRDAGEADPGERTFASVRSVLDTGSDAVELSIRTVSDQRTFVEGDRIAYEVDVSQEGYLYLLVFSEGDVASCIFPNPTDSVNRVSPGTVTLPRNDSYRFPVGAPFGRDLHVALFTKTPINLGEKRRYRWAQILGQIDPALLDEKSRGVGVEPTPEIWRGASLILESKRR